MSGSRQPVVADTETWLGVQEASADVADEAPAAEQTAGDAETVSQ